MGNLVTPPSVQKLQTALHAKAKDEPSCRFHALYDKLYREDVRPLGIPTIRDRVVQMAMVLVLGPIFEADLPPEQYAYRPDRNAHDAIRQVHSLLKTGHRQVVDADLAAYLEASSHYTPRCFERLEEVRKRCRYLYSQAFRTSAVDVNGLELAALYTLQDRLRETPSSFMALNIFT